MLQLRSLDANPLQGKLLLCGIPELLRYRPGEFLLPHRDSGTRNLVAIWNLKGEKEFKVWDDRNGEKTVLDTPTGSLTLLRDIGFNGADRGPLHAVEAKTECLSLVLR